MSNISDFKDALVVQANLIADNLSKLECLAAIDEWYACHVAVSSFQANPLQSYTYGGKTITRKNSAEFESSERRLRAKIEELLYCGGSGLVDNRSPQTTVTAL